jgi:integral membrane sensor domain MASE1
MIKEIRLLIKLKLKYLKELWSLINVAIIGCSWGSIGVYIWSFDESNKISELFKETNGYIFINLQISVSINNLLRYLRGFCCFFSMIKLIHLCQMNSRLALFLQTLEHSAKELISFLTMFSIIFMGFVSLFYLLFSSKIFSSSDLFGTVTMLFQMTVLKYSTSQFYVADATLGPLCFSIFILVVVFICLSMFLSILNDNFRRERKNRQEREEILSFAVKRFLRWTGNIILFI